MDEKFRIIEGTLYHRILPDEYWYECTNRQCVAYFQGKIEELSDSTEKMMWERLVKKLAGVRL